MMRAPAQAPHSSRRGSPPELIEDHGTYAGVNAWARHAYPVMPRYTPQRGWLFHFTHVQHLETIIREGLQCDSNCQGTVLQVEAGDPGIKAARRMKRVPLPPGGVVADYVPFYFAPRSPMLYVITKGQVPTFRDSQENLIYLVTSVDRVAEAGRPVLISDRNASMNVAEFTDDRSRIATMIDWDLMNDWYWADTLEDRTRKERRMAEFLVHHHLPWSAVIGIGVFDANRCQVAEATLARLNMQTPVRVMRDWYY
jgi:ssDNA thymidine ADP-ribosyltransferase DarT-like protein